GYGGGAKETGDLGRTTVKCRRSRVAIASAPSRSAIAMTEAPTAQRGKSAYFSTNSTIRSTSTRGRGSADLPGADGAQERRLRAGALLPLRQVADLGEHGIRDEQRPGCVPHQLDASGMVLVVGIRGGDERAGVPDDHSGLRPISARRISLDRAARSPLPLDNAPTKSGSAHSSPSSVCVLSR